MDCIQLSLFGKMYPEHSAQTEEETSVPCWKNLPAWNNQTLSFLNLRGGGRWSKAGTIVGNGWSLAWRQLDAQYWGVPQRRKRIALVVDFAGQPLIQGLAVTLLSLLFVVMPSVQSFYQILSQLTVLLYLIMYLLMFSGAIYLRYNMKKAPRPFRIGSKGNGLMWLIGGLGFCGSLLAFVLSFIPPRQIAVGSNTVWFAVLIIGCVVVVAAPFIIYASRKPSWVDKDTQFEPFHWEEQATTAQTAAPVSGAAKSSASSASTNAAAGPASQSTPTPEQHK